MSRHIHTVLVLLVVACFSAAALAQVGYESPGAYQARVIDEHWRDPARNRVIPLRIRVPAAPGSRPVILFSHGLGGSADSGRAWGEHWASYGFIVIHMQHPGSDAHVWQNAQRPALALRQAASAEQYLARVNDVRFVLDELQRRTLTAADWARLADVARIGMSGHSFGAVTTLAVAGRGVAKSARQETAGGNLADAHPRAFIAFSPQSRGERDRASFGAIDRPVFTVTGTEDGEVGAGLGVAPALRLLPFEFMPAGDKYLLNLSGADHMTFNGVGRRSGALTRQAKPDPARDALHERLIKGTTTAFWLAFLADDAAAKSWLLAADAYIGTAGEFKRR